VHVVKQEIAKEGILPKAKFFAQTKNLSLGRFLSWLESDKHTFINKNFNWLLRKPWMDPKEHSQDTPFGALFLHWVFTVIMILVTIRLDPTSAYGVLVNLYSYTIVAVFGFAIAIGMLKLRFSRRAEWRKKSNFNAWASIISAAIFAVGSAYPIIASWVPPNGSYAKATKLTVPWFTTPAVAWSILGFGLAWYVGFNLYAMRRARNEGVVFQVEKEPLIENDPEPDGPPVQTHETVYLAWVDKEYTHRQRVEMEEPRRSRERRESF
jgi:Amino acid permease